MIVVQKFQTKSVMRCMIKTTERPDFEDRLREVENSGIIIDHPSDSTNFEVNLFWL